MEDTTQLNILRRRHIAVSRQIKDLFWRIVPRRWLWRWLFLDDRGELRRCGEAALADLREFAFVRRTSFHKDPLMMARAEGRREVALRIINYLDLDEAQVQQLIGADDGL